jgi:(2Fe-2S) ferredoxin
MKLEDLKKMTEASTDRIELDEGDARYKIVVGMGTCGIAAGAREVLAALVDELDKRDIEDVIVTQEGCKGICEREPMLDVIDEDETAVTYGDLTPERAREIIARHVVDGETVMEYLVEVG